MLHIASGFFAAHVVTFQLVDDAHDIGCEFRKLGKQQVGFLGVVQTLRKFIDVKQHGTHHVKEFMTLICWPTFDHHLHGIQHGRQ